MRRAAGLALLVLLPLVAAALIGELLVRASGALDAAPVPRRLMVETELPGLPYRLRPGVRLRWFGEPLTTNSVGLRGAELEATAQRRLLVLGDSVAFGWRVGDSETFPVRLERELAARGEHWEVVNGGVPGYDAAATGAFLRHVGLGLKPDVVVLCVSLNDFSEPPRLSAQGVLLLSPGPTSWWMRHSELALFVRWTLGSWWRSSSEADVERFLQGQAIAAREAFYRDPTGPAGGRLRSALGTLRDLAAGAGSRLYLVVFPERDQVAAAAAPVPQRVWRQWCADLGLDCLDLLPRFAQQGTELFVDLQHPNTAGLELAARAAAEHLTAPPAASRR